jgi:effector-binding domain-containing protein
MTEFKIARFVLGCLVLGMCLVPQPPACFAQMARPPVPGDPSSTDKGAVAAPPETGTEAKPRVDSAGDLASMTIDLAARPVVKARRKAEWNGGFEAIMESIGKVAAAIKAAGLAQGGRPFALFLETDEESFQFEAMIPLAQAPQGKVTLADGVEIGTSPVGKAIKFQHRGPYDEIESTYNLITTFLDEKGLDARDMFIEEYLTDTKEPADVGLEVDIYVFLK